MVVKQSTNHTNHDRFQPPTLIQTLKIAPFRGYTVEPRWKGQESLTKVAKFGPFSCTILYKSCLLYPSWQATSFERPPSWVAFIKGFHCIVFVLGFSYQNAFIASQRIHNANNVITSKLCCDFVSTYGNNDVTAVLYVRWDRTILPLRPRLHYIKYTVHWLYCSGCWFHHYPNGPETGREASWGSELVPSKKVKLEILPCGTKFH